MRRALRLICAAAAAIACSCGEPVLAAGGLSVSPVSLTFDAQGRAQALEVSNPGAEATQVQVRLFAWALVDGEDRLEPSADIGFSPPMFRLEPGANQVVRLISMKPAGEREAAYRLFVDQLPEEPEPGRLQMPIRMALPLFVSGGDTKTAPAGNLVWRLSFDAAAHRARLTAVNAGLRRVKVMELTYLAGGEKRPIAPGLSGYVLAGAARDWSFDFSGPPQALDLRLLADGEAASARAEPGGG